MMAVGNDELGLSVKKGDFVVKGELAGHLQYGKDGETGEESNTLGFITVDDKSYLVSVNDQLLAGWKIIDYWEYIDE